MQSTPRLPRLTRCLVSRNVSSEADISKRAIIHTAAHFFAVFSFLLSGAIARAQEEGTEAKSPALSNLATVAESSDFTATATEADVESYMRELASHWPAAELTTVGQTTEGRPLWALVVAPQTTSKAKPVTVLVLGGIHSGECDGKEAILALARDMARGKQGDWWHPLRLIFVPNFNADANERRGAGHRPGQAGPSQGMGLRANAQGLDLNRDFVKLDSPEVRGLVAALNAYDVDALIDTHTTNGSLHQYQLTYDIPHNPAAPAATDQWLRNQLLPTVTERLEKQGFPTFYYGNFDREHRKWSTYGHQPRYSTEYMGLRGRIGILSESYSYVPYKTRVDVSYAFVTEVLKGLAENADTVRQLIDDAEFLARPGQALPVQAELAETSQAVRVKGFETTDGKTPQPPYGEAALKSHSPRDYVVSFWNRANPTSQVSLPIGYVIPEQNAWAVGRLVRHGVQVHQLTENTKVDAEVYRVDEVKKLSDFQRHAMQALTVSSEAAQPTIPAGSYYVATTQPLGILASYLLEPHSEDSLATWNFFDPDVAKDARFPVLRVVSSIRDDLLRPATSISPSETITLEHLMKPGSTVAYAGNRVRGATWLKKSTEYVVTADRRTQIIDAATGNTRWLDELDSLRAKLADLEAFTSAEANRAATTEAFGDDWQRALVSHKKDLFFFDAEEDVVRRITHTEDQPEQLAELSPSGRHAAYVSDNNLWLADCQSTEQRQLTDDGNVEILNGILDWVYQEELYGRGNFKAFWWSPDGKRIAYLKLDQTPVPSYQVSDSISYGQSLEATRYPKAGEPLPTVSVCIVDVDTGDTRQCDLSSFPDEKLVARVSWSPDGTLWLQVFNRVQNQQSLVRVATDSGNTQTLFTEVSPGWIEVRGTPEFLDNGDFLWLSDMPGGRTHLFRVSSADGTRTQLTRGDWDVSSFAGVSEDQSTAFVMGNISHPIDTQLVAIDLATGENRQVTFAPGTHRVQIDASGSYFIDVFSSLHSPPLASLHSIDGQMLRVVEAPIADRYQYLDITAPRNFTIKARDGLELQAQLMLPPGFDPDQPDRKLPVVFYVYGGPQAPTVVNSWAGRNYWWHQMLCQQGFAVVLCDNRSARGRGVKDTWTIRGDMCRVELQDLEDAVGWVNDQPWADSDRIGLWGWSYGGYFTSYALTHSPLFRCGIAGAPVTDWRNYDAIYTERYMDLPQDNPDGYASSSSVEAAADLSGRLLIIHGERDDNVHMSNSMQLAYALQQAGKQFELMIYPKNRHGIVNPPQRYHMYQMMTDFLKRNLTP